MPDVRRSEGFLATAKRLCSTEGGLEPTQDDLRTADGRCYYAVFHKLSEMIADDFAGREGDPDRSGRAWAELYRFLDHNRARKACFRAISDDIDFPSEIKEFAQIFPQLQAARHAADYPTGGATSLVESRELIESAERIMNGLEKVAKKDRMAFGTWVTISGIGVEEERKLARAKNSESLFTNAKPRQKANGNPPKAESDSDRD